MKNFIEKFNIETQGLYPYIRLKEANVSLRKKQIELVMLYPEHLGELSEIDRSAITCVVKKMLNSNAGVVVKLLKSHFDTDDFKVRLLEFFKSYPSVGTTVAAESVEAGAAKGADSAFARVKLDAVIFDYCIERNIEAEVNSFLERNYCEPITFSFIKKEAGVEEALIADDEESPALALELPGGRFIQPENVDAFIGAPIYERALYIEDAVRPRESLTVCGTLTEISEVRYLNKADGKEKNFYRFSISDFTGALECLCFPNRYTADKLSLLKTNKQIVARGSLEPDKKNEGSLIFVVKDISYCTLPADFVPNRFIRSVSAHYGAVFPQVYQGVSQVSLFDAPVQARVAMPFKDKTIVVFDLETTGFSPLNDSIIEIGAVKIVNGARTEAFSSLIDPGIPIPENITKLTGIADRDVAGKPSIGDVMPDFYKFVDGAELVAHNLQFDLGFVGAKGKPLGIFFDHPKHDTLYLARKTFPGLPHYGLGFLVEHFGIELKSAHRALDDAAATAELLTRIWNAYEA